MGDVPFLLGGWSGRKDHAGKVFDREVSARKSDLGAVRAAINFARKKGRFKAEGQVGYLTSRGEYECEYELVE